MGDIGATIRLVVDVLLFLDARRTASRERREDPEYLAEDVSALPLAGLLTRNASQNTTTAAGAAGAVGRVGSYQDDLASLGTEPLNDTEDESDATSSDEARLRSGSHVRNLVQQQRRHSKRRMEQEKEKENSNKTSSVSSASNPRNKSFLGLGKRRGGHARKNKRSDNQQNKGRDSGVKSAADQEDEELLDFAKTFFTWAESRLEEQGADEGLRREVHVAGQSLVEDDWDALRKVFEPALGDSQQLDDQRKQSVSAHAATDSSTEASSTTSSEATASQQSTVRRHRRPRTVSKSAHLIPIPPAETSKREATTASTVSNLQKLILRIEDVLVDDLEDSTVTVAKKVDQSAVYVQKKLHKAVLKRRSRRRRKRAATDAVHNGKVEDTGSNSDEDNNLDTGDEAAEVDDDDDVVGDTIDGEGNLQAVEGESDSKSNTAAATAAAESSGGGVLDGIVRSLSYLQRLSLGRIASPSVSEETPSSPEEESVQPSPLPESTPQEPDVEGDNNGSMAARWPVEADEERTERSGTVLRSPLSDVEETVSRAHSSSSDMGSASATKRGKLRHKLGRHRPHRPHLFHRHRHQRKGEATRGSAPPSRRRQHSNARGGAIDKATMRASKVGTRQQARLEALRKILSQQRRSVNEAVIPRHMLYESDELLASAPEYRPQGQSEGKPLVVKLKRFSPRFLRKDAGTNGTTTMMLVSDGPAAGKSDGGDASQSDVEMSGSEVEEECDGEDGCGPDQVDGLLKNFEEVGQKKVKDDGVRDKWREYIDLLRSASWFPTAAEKTLFFRNTAAPTDTDTDATGAGGGGAGGGSGEGHSGMSADESNPTGVN